MAIPSVSITYPISYFLYLSFLLETQLRMIPTEVQMITIYIYCCSLTSLTVFNSFANYFTNFINKYYSICSNNFRS